MSLIFLFFQILRLSQTISTFELYRSLASIRLCLSIWELSINQLWYVRTMYLFKHHRSRLFLVVVLKACFILPRSEFVVKVSGCWSPRESTKFSLWMQPVPSRCRDLSPLCNAIACNAVSYITFCPTTILAAAQFYCNCFLSYTSDFFVACLPRRLLPAVLCWGMRAQEWRCYQGLRHCVLENLFCLGVLWGSKASHFWSGENAISLLWRVLEEPVVERLRAKGPCSSTQGSRSSPSELQTLCSALCFWEMLQGSQSVSWKVV